MPYRYHKNFQTREHRTGAFVEVDKETGWVTKIYLCGHSDQEVAVIAGALARISNRRSWGWLRRLIGR